MATPLMEQYFRLKKEAGDSFLFFRMGDFYELFFQDAEKVSSLLGLTLTARGTHDDKPIPMCGIPHHAASEYVDRLTKMGYLVAIAEQVQDPKEAKEAKGIVERAIVRIASQTQPFDPMNLAAESSPILVVLLGKKWAAGDPTTLLVQTGEMESLDDVGELLRRLRASELVTSEKIADIPSGINVLPLPEIGEEKPSARRVFEMVLRERTKKNLFVSESLMSQGSTMEIDSVSVDALGLLPMGDEPSLFKTLAQMKTAMGLRLLRARILAPSSRYEEIIRLQKLTQDLASDLARLNELQGRLAKIRDIERLTMKLCTSGIHGKEMLALVASLEVSADVLGVSPQRFQDWKNRLLEEPALWAKDGDVFSLQASPELEHLRTLKTAGVAWFAEYEAKLRETHQISNLKIKYSRVFGYTIEVTQSHLSKVPAFFIRRQTIAGGERFVTEELLKFQDDLSHAEEKRIALEQKLWTQLCGEVLAVSDEIRQMSQKIAEIDYHAGLASLARRMGHKFAEVVPRGDIVLRHAVHPILETQFLGRKLVANDILISENQPLILLTGPNMAGKSTLMKQVALLCHMTHLGAAIPCKDGSRVPVIDAILTRVGSSDRLFDSQSTFMVEMVETARILKRATPSSLVLMDEVGRGTSTYDGMSLAWAIVEHLARHQVRGFFATHYHELTSLPEEFPALVNKHVSVLKKGGKIEYLYRLTDGPSPGSFGLQVASLAGLNATIIDRAASILKKLESGSSPSVMNSAQLSLFESKTEKKADHPLVQEIRLMDVDGITPREALQILSRLKDSIDIDPSRNQML